MFEITYTDSTALKSIAQLSGVHYALVMLIKIKKKKKIKMINIINSTG